VAFTRVLIGGAGVDRIPSDTMREAMVGGERVSREGGWWRPASPSLVGTVLGGDSGLAAKLLVSIVEGNHEVGPSLLGQGVHAPLTDGFRVGAHGLKDSKSGLHNCGPRDVVMANRKELELFWQAHRPKMGWDGSQGVRRAVAFSSNSSAVTVA